MPSQQQSVIDALINDQIDPSRMAGGPPGQGRLAVPHVLSFRSLLGSIARVYRSSDEALRASIDNARFMRNDVGIMECIQARQRMLALLPWHLEPEDENSQDQKALCDKMTNILSRIRRFTEYRRCLMEAVWYGRAGVQHSYNRQMIGHESFIMPSPQANREHPGWLPINGDKLVFRYDDTRYSTAGNSKSAGSVGIMVNQMHAGAQIDHRYVETTDRGLAYFFPTWQRSLVAIHRHELEDAAWEDPLNAGSLNGVGIRSRIYWEWFQKQECLAYLLEFLERSASGIEIWTYPAGNADAQREVEEMANRRGGANKNVLLFPKPMGDVGDQFNVEIKEIGMAGAEVLKNLLMEYFGHRIKRLILGQTLTSEADATGLGSGVADLHMDTLNQIIQYDARNLEETMTYELVAQIQKFNFPAAKFHIRFVIDTEETDGAGKLEAYLNAWQMGARLKESDVLDAIGSSVPTGDDVVLHNPGVSPTDLAGNPLFQPQMPMPGMEGGPEMPSMPGAPGQGGDDGGNRNGGPVQPDSGIPGDGDNDGIAGESDESDDYSATGGNGDSSTFNPVAFGFDLAAELATLTTTSTATNGQPQQPISASYSRADHAAKLTNTDPSEAQLEAGNYRKGTFSCHGYTFAIENPKGSIRRGTDSTGKSWEIEMVNHYGYMKRTTGADNDAIDVFIGPNPTNDLVYVVDQIDPETGDFDEHKCMIGFNNLGQARRAYKRSYAKGWGGMMEITPLTWQQFDRWLSGDGDRSQPIFNQELAATTSAELVTA